MNNDSKHQDYLKALLGVVDCFFNNHQQSKVRGRPKKYSDAVILKLMLLMHLCRLDGETHLLRHVKRHYQQWFPILPSQSRLWHRIREGLLIAEEFRQHLLRIFGHLYEDIRIFDTMPLPVCPLERAAKLSEFPLADFGYCASRKEHYFGFKLGLSILPIGLPDVIEILPARPHDVNYLSELVDSGGVIYLGDKGFICEQRINMLEKQDEKLVITPNRDNHQGAGNTDLENMLLWVWRNKIEAVFSILTHMRLKKTGAKTMNGLIKRVYGIVLAFSVGVYINVVHGRYPLEVVQLFG